MTEYENKDSGVFIFVINCKKLLGSKTPCDLLIVRNYQYQFLTHFLPNFVV